MAKSLEIVFVAYRMSEYIINGEERIHIEGFKGMKVEGYPIREIGFQSYDWKAKNKKALLAKIKREIGEIVAIK